MKTKTYVITSIVFLALCTIPSSVFAKHDSGTGTYVRVSSEMSQRPDGSQVITFLNKGEIMAEDHDSLLHLCTQDISGTLVVGPDGNPVLAIGYANGIDKDGDVFWIWWRNSAESREWGFLGGTGKFKGIQGGGTTRRLSDHPDGRYSIAWEGEWSIRK